MSNPPGPTPSLGIETNLGAVSIQTRWQLRSTVGSEVIMRIAVTGATGYIGGRLVPRLIAEGHELVCPARNPAKLAGRS